MNRGTRMLLLVSAGALVSGAAVTTGEPIADPHKWLEDVNGSRALAQVRKWNKATEETLTSDPRHAAMQQALDAILAADGKVVAPQFAGEHIYRLRQGAGNPQGVWERAPGASYRAGLVAWQPVLDLDELGLREGKKWFWRGAVCSPFDGNRCLVVLSDGGQDRWEIREYDVGSRRFVDGGLRLPATKGAPTHLEVTDLPVAWLDHDTVIATRVWSPDAATTAGYGYVVKKLKRGQPIQDAVEVFRGKSTDVSAVPLVFRDGQGNQVALVSRRLGFFETEYHVIGDKGAVLLPLPKGVTARGLLDGRLLVTLRQDWTYAGQRYLEGSVVALDIETATRAPAQLRPELVMAPNDRQAIDQVLVTRDRALVSVYTNVQGELFTAARKGGRWRAERFDTPPMSSVALVSTAIDDNSFSYLTESYLTPEALRLGDALTGEARLIEAGVAHFDARGHVTEQHEARARDGTKIPYYVVRPKRAAADGTNPTILCAYGGLQYVNAPSYFPFTGKLWLEPGGSLVIAHIRGGGEFGPKWHRAAQRSKRQVAFDDFAAVAEDLIRRGHTSPKHLGIRGSSNGGLLAGVEFTQRPELWSAALLNVGLYDMVNYTGMLAGASWMSEFGDPDDPVEGAFLRRISPYHNVKAGVSYPPPLIMTATSDDRVHPGHSRKLAARLDAVGRPFFYNEVAEGGHGGKGEGGPCGSTERAALEFTYFRQRLGLP